MGEFRQLATIRKRGKFWFFRGTIPARQADGTIARVRHEESLKTQSRVDAAKRAADLERHYWNLAYGPDKRKSVSFAQAALTYIETRQKSDRYITKLIEHFGETPIDQIDQQAATEAASKLYPGWGANSITRAIFTPLSAIGVKGLKRPTILPPSIGIPDNCWFDAILPACPPKLAALIVFLTLTGRRVGEAIALTEKDIDAEGNVHIGRTKTGVAVVCRLPDLCRSFLAVDGASHRSRSKRLFGYSQTTHAHRALGRACKRAGVAKFGFHSLGRRAFATRCLKAGWSLKEVQEAGGWKTIGVVASRYLHLERQDIQNRVQELGAEWSRKRKT